MSASAATLSCPVCAQVGAFNSVASLRDKLICVSTNKILCPVCQEEVIGLDKLTIHLFSHVNITNFKENPKSNEGNNSASKEVVLKSQSKKSKASVTSSKNKPPPTNIPVKFVKIYPKLPVISINTIPIIENMSQTQAQLETDNNNCNEMKNSVSASITIAEGSVLPKNLCNICGLQFGDTNILKMHKNLIHSIDENTKHSLTRYNCHLCPKNFKMRGSLMVHLRVAHLGFSAANKNVNKNDEKISSEQGQDQNDNKSSALERNDNKQWQCDVCRKSFTTKYFLKKHKRLHTGETPYACSQCNKTFTFQQSYHKHLLYHNDDKPHTCTFCGRAFKELSTLHNHQRIHTGEKPFSCETCGKCFRQRVSYLVHRRIHTGVMPYKCTACNKSFRYKVSQRTHKCLAQPPGTVVRQHCDNLVEKLKKKNHSTDIIYQEKFDELTKTRACDTDNTLFTTQASFTQVSEANAELVRKGSKLSLEDMESENFNLIADTFPENNCEIDSQSIMIANLQNDLSFESNDLINCFPGDDKSVPSPSEILKNLCLSKEEDFTEILQISNNI